MAMGAYGSCSEQEADKKADNAQRSGTVYNT